ncbi:MAG: EamA family transporter, partial [Solirubrobacterales bacterium]
MLAFAISLASAFSWGVSDFLGGQQSRRLPVLGVLAVSQPAGLILIAVLIPLVGADPISADKLAIAFLAGAASLGGLGAFYAAMAMGTVSVVAPIAALGVVVPVGVGLAEGEAPAAIQLAGLVPAMAGVVVLSYEENPAHAGTARRSIA